MTRQSSSHRGVDREATRRRFLFAREQLSAHSFEAYMQAVQYTSFRGAGPERQARRGYGQARTD